MNINGKCFKVPDNCLTIDDKGFCINCLAGYLIIQGQCVKIITCEKGYYLNENYVCILADPSCDKINPTSGKCITCKDKGSSPNEGTCCPKGQLYDQGSKSCVEISVLQTAFNNNLLSGPACRIRHPSLGSCLGCNTGYIVDPITNQNCIPKAWKTWLSIIHHLKFFENHF